MNRDIRATFIARDRTAAAARSARANVESVGASYNRLVGQVGAANRAIAAATLSVGGTNAIATLANLQDGFSRLSAVTRTYAEDQAYLAKKANEFSVDIQAATDLFGRLRVLQDSGAVTDNQIPQYFEGLSDAFARFGAGAAQRENVIYGLAQALGQGNLQAAELNQVVEPLPGLLNDIARAAGVTAAEYRGLVKTGQITSKLFGEQILGALQSYEGAAARLSGNIRQILTRLSNAYKEALVALNAPITSGINDFAKVLTSGLNAIANNADKFVEGFKLVGTALLLAFAAPRLALVANFSKNYVTSVAAMVAADRARAASAVQATAAAQAAARQEALVAATRERNAAREAVATAARAANSERAAAAERLRADAAARANVAQTSSSVRRANAENLRQQNQLTAAIRERAVEQQRLGQQIQSARTDSSLAAANAAAIRREKNRVESLRNLAQANVDAATSTQRRAEKQRVLVQRTRELREVEGRLQTAERAQRAAQENRDRLAGLARINAAARDDLELTRRRTAVSEDFRAAQARVTGAQQNVTAATRAAAQAGRALEAEQRRLAQAEGARAQSAEQRRAGQERLAQLTAAQTAAQRRVDAATRAYTQARAAANAADAAGAGGAGRLTLAQRALTAATTAGAFAARGLATAYAAIGGGFTVFLAAAFAVFTLYRRFNELNPVVERAQTNIETLRREYEGLVNPAKQLAEASGDYVTQLQIEIEAIRKRNEELGKGAEAIAEAVGFYDTLKATFAAGFELSGIEIFEAFKNKKAIEDANEAMAETIRLEEEIATIQNSAVERMKRRNDAVNAARASERAAAEDAAEALQDNAAKIVASYGGVEAKIEELVAKQRLLREAFAAPGTEITQTQYDRANRALDEELAKLQRNEAAVRERRRAQEAFEKRTSNLELAGIEAQGPLDGLQERARRAYAEINELAARAGVADETRFRTLALAAEEFAREELAIRKELADAEVRLEEEKQQRLQQARAKALQQSAAADSARLQALATISPLGAVEERRQQRVAQFEREARENAELARQRELVITGIELDAQREREAAKTQIMQEAAERRAELQKVAAVNVAANVIGNLTQAAASEVGSYITLTKEMSAAERAAAERSNKVNRKRFNDNKKLQLASAYINALAGFNAAIAQGGWLGFGQALTVLSAGLASVRKINNTSYGSTGGGSSLGTSGGGAERAAPTAQDFDPNASDRDQGTVYNITLVSADELIDPAVLQRRVEDAVDRSSRARRLNLADGRLSGNSERVF